MLFYSRFGAAALGLMLLAAGAGQIRAEVTSFTVSSTDVHGTFGERHYVRLVAKLGGRLSVKEAIPDLVKADADKDGWVNYSTQVILWVPADPREGNGTLLIDLANRGHPITHALYNAPRHFPPEGEGPLPADPLKPPIGVGFLERNGFLIAAPTWELGRGITLPTFKDDEGKTRYVEGVGFAVARDTAAYLRWAKADSAGHANPLAGAVHDVIAVGYSQTSRFLKSFLLAGFNTLDGKRVFDGMQMHVPHAGLLPIMTSGTGPLSMADATPSFTNPDIPGIHQPPFTWPEIVGTAVAHGEKAPKIMVTNAATDYFSLRASFARTGHRQMQDRPVPDELRIYDMAGAPHVLWANKDGCANPRGIVDWHPLLRALLLHLQAWERDGKEPPQSRMFPLRIAARGDPMVLGPPKQTPGSLMQIPMQDDDGNDRGGVAMPDHAVPLGTDLDQNPPLTDFLCTLSGGYKPFAVTKADREATGDPRPSLEERYGNRAGYVEKIRDANSRLIADGLLAPEDARAIEEDASHIPEFK